MLTLGLEVRSNGVGYVERRDVGRRLAALRTRAGLTQQQLGERVGWMGSAISKIEKGTRGVHLDDAARLAEALGVSLAELVGAPEPAPGRPTGTDTALGELFDRLLTTWERDHELERIREENARLRIEQVESVQARERLLFQENLQRLLREPSPHAAGRRDEEAVSDGY